MLQNFDPLCPTHKTEMAAATLWVDVDSKPFPKPCFVCTQANCLYVYDPILLLKSARKRIAKSDGIAKDIPDVFLLLKAGIRIVARDVPNRGSKLSGVSDCPNTHKRPRWLYLISRKSFAKGEADKE